MTRLLVKNWRVFQHYKDRAPPWIKLQKALLDDYEFQSLPLASKALAPMIWLLASESDDGSIDACTKRLAFRLRWNEADVIAGIKPLIENGFLIDASGVLAERLHDACLETETEVEKEEEKPSCSSAAPSERETASKPTRKRKPADDRFAEFWRRYPRKVAKADAEKAWNAAHINGEYQQVIDALEAQKRTEQWTRDEGRFVPYASTWIRHQRWRDELGQKPSPLAAAFGGAL